MVWPLGHRPGRDAHLCPVPASTTIHRFWSTAGTSPTPSTRTEIGHNHRDPSPTRLSGWCRVPVRGSFLHLDACLRIGHQRTDSLQTSQPLQARRRISTGLESRAGGVLGGPRVGIGKGTPRAGMSGSGAIRRRSRRVGCRRAPKTCAVLLARAWTSTLDLSTLAIGRSRPTCRGGFLRQERTDSGYADRSRPRRTARRRASAMTKRTMLLAVMVLAACSGGRGTDHAGGG